MLKRLFCMLLAFAVLFFCSVPCFATGMEVGGAGVGIPIVGQVQLDVVDFFDYAGKELTFFNNSLSHALGSDVCQYAPTLNGGHNFVPRRTMVDGQIGLYYVCEHCGKAYGEALEEAYQEYVSELPGTQYNSDGAFLWSPGSADFVNGVSATIRYMSGSLVLTLSDASGIVSGAGNSSLVAYVGDYLLCSKGNLSMSWDSYAEGVFSDWRSVRVPVSGVYSRLDGIFASNAAGNRIVNSAYSAGTVVSLGSGKEFYSQSFRSSSSVFCPWPKFLVTPYMGGDGGNTYEITTRVSGSASDGGMFGYVQDGTLYQSTVTNIYNESSGAYQNPVTGDTATVTSWAYDYSDRSYTLTTNEGDEITVTYGDSNVTINEGGTTYNVYYLMEETEDIREEMESVCVHDYSSAVTTPPTCAASGVKTYTCSECGHSYTQTVPPTGHDYQSAVTMAPTCVGTGVRTFTCSECGDSYTVSIAATGHTWEVISTVPTTYDSETGQLIQQGYTLYECATCHEQYRISADSGGSSLPAPSSGGTSTGGADLLEIDSDVGRGFLATIAQGLTHDLPEVLEAASGWFTTFPQFYSGFVTFVKDGVAGCLPDMPRQMMGFGFGMTTLIGIVRKIFGR